MWEEIFVIENSRSRSVPLPAQVDRSVFPVTDGTRVYAYSDGRGETAGGRRLVAFTVDGREDETVTGFTPLVEPRGLFSTPDGMFLAFFLDNRQSLATELWTYDAASRTKRVSVERLTRGDVQGPYFSADGSFLLFHGGQLLQGSSRRTGVDILPLAVDRPERVRWDGNVVASPEKERVLAVVEMGDDVTAVARVLQLAPPNGRSVLRFSRANEEVRILRWAEPDNILLHSRPRTPAARRGSARTNLSSVWVLQGGQSISHALGDGATSPIAAEDGTSVGFLREGEGRVRVEVLHIETGRMRSAASLPAGRPGAAFQLLQYVRVPLPASSRPSAPSPSPELLLQYVSDHIRALADAPEAEPVTAERIWLTAAPDALYVDYRVGTMLWRRSVRLDIQGGSPAGASVVGVFAAAGGEWVLVRGEDLADRTPVALYEFESDLRQWVEKPLAEYSL